MTSVAFVVNCNDPPRCRRVKCATGSSSSRAFNSSSVAVCSRAIACETALTASMKMRHHAPNKAADSAMPQMSFSDEDSS